MPRRSWSETVELGSRSHGAIVKGVRDMLNGLVWCEGGAPIKATKMEALVVDYDGLRVPPIVTTLDWIPLSYRFKRLGPTLRFPTTNDR